MAKGFLCDRFICTECMSCQSICPKDAISVVALQDQAGIQLVVDECLCNGCGLCKSSCPLQTACSANASVATLAAWSTDPNDQEKSSSGGVATALSRKIVRSGGVVYGSAVIEKRNGMCRVTDLDSLELLRGSKYVQSDTGNTYVNCKKDLMSGKKVLFISTPCKVAGLRAYLKKDFENLVTVDLICHGVAPQEYLVKHIDESIKQGTWTSYSFRGKNNFMLTVYRDDEEVYKRRSSRDEYFCAYLESMIFIDACYSCRFAKQERVGDLTLGDFWGLDKGSLKLKCPRRASLVLVNTPKGESVIESMADELAVEERDYLEANNESQGNLLKPSSRHKESGKFISYYRSLGFNGAFRRTSLGRILLLKEAYDRLKGLTKR